MTPKNTSDKSKVSPSSDKFIKDPLRQKIGGGLRRLYDDVLNEPVPDDFLSLLAKADDAEDRHD